MRGKTPEDQRLLELLDPVADAAGFAIVRLRLMGGGVRRLQIMGERPDGSMTISDCTRLTRAFNDVLDAADPISDEYTLEVSTPGIDRPLTRLADFETYKGLEARLELDRLVDGRKRFKGVISGVEDREVLIEADGEDAAARLPFAWIAEAKLVLNDDLMKRGAAEREARLAAEAAETDPDKED